jgi:hypothetical protein
LDNARGVIQSATVLSRGRLNQTTVETATASLVPRALHIASAGNLLMRERLRARLSLNLIAHQSGVESEIQ